MSILNRLKARIIKPDPAKAPEEIPAQAIQNDTHTRLAAVKSYDDEAAALIEQPGGLIGAIEAILSASKPDKDKLIAFIKFAYKVGTGTAITRLSQVIRSLALGVIPKEDITLLSEELSGIAPHLEWVLSQDIEQIKSVSQNILANPNYLDDFFYKEVMTNSAVQKQAQRVARYRPFDQDDAGTLIPLCTNEDLRFAVLSPLEGQPSALSSEGHANAIAGFTRMLESVNSPQLAVQVMLSFVEYESTLNNRNHYKKSTYRLNPASLSRKPAVNYKDRTVKQHLDNSISKIRKVMEAYGFSELEIQQFLYLSAAKNGKDTQDFDQRFMNDFPKKFETTILNSKDKGQGVLKILRGESS